MKKKKIRICDREGTYEIKFWKDWLEARNLNRLDMVEKLPLFKMCLKMEDSQMWREAFAQLINGYFEDLESAVYTKIDLENEKKKTKRKK
ncbi:MAG: hypothetical protein AABX54_05480 [Nanoarchaeota archaeon]